MMYSPGKSSVKLSLISYKHRFCWSVLMILASSNSDRKCNYLQHAQFSQFYAISKPETCKKLKADIPIVAKTLVQLFRRTMHRNSLNQFYVAQCMANYSDLQTLKWFLQTIDNK